MQIHEKLHEASHITYRLLITNSTYTLKVRKENTDTLLIQTFYIELHITPYSYNRHGIEGKPTIP